MKDRAQPLIHVATIGPAHGVRGAVTVRCFLEVPSGLGRYNPLTTADGRKLVLRVQSERKPGVLVATVEGVGERSGAEALRGCALFVPRDRLPAADEEEFYHADLIGMAALDPKGRTLGRVVAVQDFGAGDLLEIETGARRTVFVPFTRAVVPDIRLDERCLVVDAPPGLLDDGADSGAGGDVEG